MKCADARARFEFAKEMIVSSGNYLLSIADERCSVMTKHKNDFVTLADKNNENFIISAIREKFPSDSFFGEESGENEVSSTGRWVIDPIDGTVNFMHSFPDYTISVAYENGEGELTFGLVYVPMQKELFAAFNGEGATLNGMPIHVSESTEFGKELAICVYPHRHREALDLYQSRMRRILDFTTDLRSIGSAALSLCYVASARCVAYYELFLGWYDMAAGLVILKEAGGRFNLDKRSDFDIDIAAGSSNVFPQLMEAVRD